MISLDQILLLEQKIEGVVAKIQQLQAENDALRKSCAELTNALSVKSEQLSVFEQERNQIESGIINALGKLNSIENSVLGSATENPVEQTDSQSETSPALQDYPNENEENEETSEDENQEQETQQPQEELLLETEPAQSEEVDTEETYQETEESDEQEEVSYQQEPQETEQPIEDYPQNENISSESAEYEEETDDDYGAQNSLDFSDDFAPEQPEEDGEAEFSDDQNNESSDNGYLDIFY